jgi:conjugal transfer/entry exclusion protein
MEELEHTLKKIEEQIEKETDQMTEIVKNLESLKKQKKAIQAVMFTITKEY